MVGLRHVATSNPIHTSHPISSAYPPTAIWHHHPQSTLAMLAKFTSVFLFVKANGIRQSYNVSLCLENLDVKKKKTRSFKTLRISKTRYLIFILFYSNTSGNFLFEIPYKSFPLFFFKVNTFS